MDETPQPEAKAKSPTGIEGLDHLTGGGLPARQTTLVLGSTGTGKTLLALQTLANAARRGEPGLFVTFGETARQLEQNAVCMGWNLRELGQGRLTFLEADLCPGAAIGAGIDLCGLVARLRAAMAETQAQHVAFDSFHLLLALVNDQLAEWQEVFRLREWLLESAVTGIITADLACADGPARRRLAFLQCIADCTIALDFQTGPGAGSRHLRIQKYRGSSFVEGEYPLLIDSGGMRVLVPQAGKNGPSLEQPGSLHPEIERAREELNARVQALDRLLQIKQAELDFLLEQEKSSKANIPPAAGARRLRRPPSGSRPR